MNKNLFTSYKYYTSYRFLPTLFSSSRSFILERRIKMMADTSKEEVSYGNRSGGRFQQIPKYTTRVVLWYVTVCMYACMYVCTVCMYVPVAPTVSTGSVHYILSHSCKYLHTDKPSHTYNKHIYAYIIIYFIHMYI